MKYKYFIVNKAVLYFDNQHDNQHLTFKVFHNHKLIFLYPTWFSTVSPNELSTMIYFFLPLSSSLYVTASNIGHSNYCIICITILPASKRFPSRVIVCTMLNICNYLSIIVKKIAQFLSPLHKVSKR